MSHPHAAHAANQVLRAALVWAREDVPIHTQGEADLIVAVMAYRDAVARRQGQAPRYTHTDDPSLT